MYSTNAIEIICSTSQITSKGSENKDINAQTTNASANFVYNHRAVVLPEVDKFVNKAYVLFKGEFEGLALLQVGSNSKNISRIKYNNTMGGGGGVDTFGIIAIVVLQNLIE